MEQYSKAKEAFEDNKTGLSGVSDGGIGVPGPKDHYSYSPNMYYIPFGRSHSQSYSPLALELIHPCSGAFPSPC